MDKGPGDGNALLHASGEFSGISVLETLQAHERQYVYRARSSIAFRSFFKISMGNRTLSITFLQ
jgi:hypothetical protein